MKKKDNWCWDLIQAFSKEIFTAEEVKLVRLSAHLRLNAHLRLSLQPLEPVQLLYACSASKCMPSAQLNYTKTTVQRV